MHRFLKDHYIYAIKTIALHLAHVNIIVKNECGETKEDAMK